MEMGFIIQNQIKVLVRLISLLIGIGANKLIDIVNNRVITNDDQKTYLLLHEFLIMDLEYDQLRRIKSLVEEIL